MTDHPLSDDELLSSHLDGELTVEERAQLDARLASEPDLRDRLDALSAAGALAATTVAPLAAAHADRMISAALAAGVAAGTSADNVTDLATAPQRRRVWPARVATVAAGVVALAIAVPALRSIESGTDNDAGSADTAATQVFDTGFDESGDDDSTAGDMALESSDGQGGGLFGSDEMEAAALDDDDGDSAPDDTDTAEGEIDSLAYSTNELRLFERLDGFDPLPDQLGAFENAADLSIEISERWTSYRALQDPTTTTTAAAPTTDNTDDGQNGATLDRDEFLDAARTRLDAFAGQGCDLLADVLVDYFQATGDEVVAADYAAATSAGRPVLIGLYRLTSDQAVLLVVDLDSCDIVDATLG